MKQPGEKKKKKKLTFPKTVCANLNYEKKRILHKQMVDLISIFIFRINIFVLIIRNYYTIFILFLMLKILQKIKKSNQIKFCKKLKKKKSTSNYFRYILYNL